MIRVHAAAAKNISSAVDVLKANHGKVKEIVLLRQNSQPQQVTSLHSVAKQKQHTKKEGDRFG